MVGQSYKVNFGGGREKKKKKKKRVYSESGQSTLWRQIKIKGSPDDQPFKSVWELVHLNIVITKRGVYFSLVWKQGGLVLDPS